MAGLRHYCCRWSFTSFSQYRPSLYYSQNTLAYLFSIRGLPCTPKSPPSSWVIYAIISLQGISFSALITFSFHYAGYDWATLIQVADYHFSLSYIRHAACTYYDYLLFMSFWYIFDALGFHSYFRSWFQHIRSYYYSLHHSVWYFLGLSSNKAIGFHNTQFLPALRCIYNITILLDIFRAFDIFYIGRPRHTPSHTAGSMRQATELLHIFGCWRTTIFTLSQIRNILAGPRSFSRSSFLLLLPMILILAQNYLDSTYISLFLFPSGASHTRYRSRPPADSSFIYFLVKYFPHA